MYSIKKFVFNPIGVNTYCVFDKNKNCIIIDPGCLNIQEQKQLDEFIIKNELKPILLLLTHAHLDHIFGLQYVANKYELIPYLHIEEKIILENLSSSSKKYGFENIKNYDGKVNYLDKEKIDLLNSFNIEIFETPGHSPGSVSYLFNKKDLFAGDVLFLESIGRTDLFLSNFEQLINSIKTQLFNLPDNVIVYPGHGDSTTIGHEKKHNPYIQ